MWTTGAIQETQFCAQYAAALLPLPAGLVRWSAFDEERYLAEAAARESLVPEIYQGSWKTRFPPRLTIN